MRLSLLLLVLACACRRQPTPPVTPREPVREAKPITHLTPQLALATIEQSYRPGVERCYRARLKRDPGATGKVVVTFTVDDRGKLVERDAKGVHRSIETCVERAMSRWSFPPPASPTTYRLALKLSST